MDLLSLLNAHPLPFASLLGIELISATPAGTRLRAEAIPIHRKPE